MLSLNRRFPEGHVFVSVDVVKWAEKEVKEYINKLEDEVRDLRQENRALSWKLAAVYEERHAATLLDKIRDMIEEMDTSD